MTEPAPPATAPATRLAVAVVAVLALAGCAAFFLAAQLKAAPPVIQRLDRLKSFSPNGDGRRDVERIGFRLKIDDRVSVDVIDADGGQVRHLADGLDTGGHRKVRVRWDGRDDDGARAPDGSYRVRITLRREGRSVIAPQAFELDTRPPRPAVLVRSVPVIAPGGSVDFGIRGAGPLATPKLRVLRTDVTPIRTVRSFTGEPGQRSYEWDGRRDDGSRAGPGTYLIAVSSRDRAGNEGTGPPLPPRPGAIPGRPGVTIRALAVQPPVRPVQAGGLVTFRVDARGRRYSWDVRRIGAPRPVKRNRRPKRATSVTFRAPNGISGVYLFEVAAGRHRTAVPFAVQGARRAGLTVVLPMITWLGRSPLDDATRPDGLPDTLGSRTVVRFPRLFARPGGLPQGFADDVAPLLVYLDRARIRYDLTTDLALALADAPPSPEAGGLLFAGAPEWISRGLARRLRRFADDGGKLAIFGPVALRAGVSVGDGKLAHATPPSALDALGARMAAVRRLGDEPGRLSVLVEEPGTGLLEGFAGVLGGVESVEEMVSAGTASKLLVSVGQALTEQEAAEAEAADRRPREERPAISAVRRGKGLVIRVGVPGWSARLAARDPAIAQITHNIADILRGVRPRPRSVG